MPPFRREKYPAVVVGRTTQNGAEQNQGIWMLYVQVQFIEETGARPLQMTLTLTDKMRCQCVQKGVTHPNLHGDDSTGTNVIMVLYNF